MSDAGELEHDDEETRSAPALRCAAAAFAAAVARRARRRAARRAPIACVWRRAARAMHHRGAPAGVIFAPVLRFTMIAGQREPASGPASRGARNAFVPPAPRTLASASPPPRPPLAVLAREVVATAARLASRGVRVSGAPSPSPRRAHEMALAGEGAPERPAVRPARPVPRVLRAQPRPSAAAAGNELARTEPARSSAPPASPALSASEVDRVTEHVLRTMDRRISAFRERQGRS